MTTLHQAILATLTYSDHFSFPLTLPEIHERLISGKPYSSEKVRIALQSLLKECLIQKFGEYYCLPDRSGFVANRLHRKRLALHYQLPRAKNLVSRLTTIPGVLAIYLTGSLAMMNSEVVGDIDLMIIAESNRLWITRLILTTYAEFFDLRRRPQASKPSGKLCLNLYLTPNSYSLPVTKQNLYTAYELIQAVPLYDPQNTRAALLDANRWLSNYLSNFLLPVAHRSDLVGCKSDQKPTRSDLAGYIEKLAYKLQTWYMRKKITSEYITPDAAFFHPHNPGASVLKKIDALK